MPKVIPGKEFKAAVKALNVVLKKDGGKVIKTVTIKKDIIFTEFSNKVIDYIDADKVAKLPDEVINFYNEYVVDDSSDADEDAAPADEDAAPADEDDGSDTKDVKAADEDDGPPAPKKKTVPRKKDKTGKSTPKKKPAPKKESVKRGPGLMEITVKKYLEGTTDIDALEIAIKKDFPGSNPRKSITHVCNIMKHVVNYVNK